MARNACLFHLHYCCDRPRSTFWFLTPIFRRAKHQVKRAAGINRNMHPLSTTLEANIENDLFEERMDVAATIAGAVHKNERSTVLLGFDNLIHFLDWLDAQQAECDLSLQEE